jgi:predicted TPR repeat methyltransferase
MRQSSCQKNEGSQVFYETRQLQAIAARWDAKAATWDEELANPAGHLNEDEAYVRFLREALRVIQARHGFCTRHGVIDAGCGTGLVLAAVRASFAWGIGVDISGEMIRVARTKKLEDCTFVVGDCFQLPSLCPKAGAVVSRGVLLSHYGLQQGKGLLRAAREALVPGAFLMWDFLNEGGRSMSAHAPENKTYFHGREVCAMARHAGFSRARLLGEPKRRVRFLFAEVP